MITSKNNKKRRFINSSVGHSPFIPIVLLSKMTLSQFNSKTMSNSSSSSSGIGFTGLLTVLFVGLKLTNVITWSWLWVLSPLWISFLIALAFIVILIIAAALAGLLK